MIIRDPALFRAVPLENVTSLEATPGLINAVKQWWGPLEQWRGLHFLQSPAGIISNAEMLVVLKQWWPALEGWFGVHILTQPPATYQSAQQMRTLLQGWYQRLEQRRGQHFLQYPV